MDKRIKILLVLITVFIATTLAVFVLELTGEKKEYVTDPVIAHIPLEAHLRFSFDPNDPALMTMKYTLTPSVDVKTDVSEGIVLPEGIVFVENNLPTGQITLRKNKKYEYNAKIKAVETGIWRIYASPGVYADVNAFEGDVSSVVGQGVFDATVPLTRFHLREKISEGKQDILISIIKNWLREYGTVEYEKEELNCTIISANPDIRCYGCEMISYTDLTLCEKYYFIIEEDRHTKEIKVRNVYHWAYRIPKGYQQKPVCEEITMKTTEI